MYYKIDSDIDCMADLGLICSPSEPKTFAEITGPTDFICLMYM